MFHFLDFFRRPSVATLKQRAAEEALWIEAHHASVDILRSQALHEAERNLHEAELALDKASANVALFDKRVKRLKGFE